VEEAAGCLVSSLSSSIRIITEGGINRSSFSTKESRMDDGIDCMAEFDSEELEVMTNALLTEKDWVEEHRQEVVDNGFDPDKWTRIIERCLNKLGGALGTAVN
jgi:hypothetical protein